MRWHAALLFVAYSFTQQEGYATALPDALSSPRRQCTAVAVGPEFGGLALFAGGYTHGKGNDAASSGKAVDMFDKQGRRVGTMELAVSRGTMGGATWRDLAFFGGGQDAAKNNTNVVDIFNVTSGEHTVEHLSQPRAMVAAAAAADLVFFAGGELAEDESGQGASRESRRVDIYNARLRKWVGHDDALSVARKKTAAATAGGKIIFAGGYAEALHESVGTFDMYDLQSGEWTNGSLSSKRMRLQAVSLVARDGTEYALFIGGLGAFGVEGTDPAVPYATHGLCTTVDIYNGATGEWTFTNLTRGRYEFAAAAVGTPVQDGVIISGGKQGGVGPQPWNTVELFNVSTMEWSWSKANYGWSYNAGVGLPGTSAAIFGGGDFQNGTTTNFTQVVDAASVSTPPHHPTFFPDLHGPSRLLVASLLDGKGMQWGTSDAIKDAELVMLGSLSGVLIRHSAEVGVFIESCLDHRQTLAMLRQTAIAVHAGKTGQQRLHVVTEYASGTPLQLAARLLLETASATAAPGAPTGPIVAQYVKVDLSNPASLNYAKMQAWAHDGAIILDTTIAERVATTLNLTLAFDATESSLDQTLALAQEWVAKRGPLNLSVEQPSGPYMVDYSVATSAASWYAGDSGSAKKPGAAPSYNSSIRNKFLGLLQPNSANLGWGCNWTSEVECVTVSARHGVFVEPSQTDYSLLVYGSYHHHSHFPFVQGAEIRATHPRAPPPLPSPPPPPPPVHTVVFVTSGGDNVHWLHDGWLSQIWKAKERGTFPLALGLNPSQRDLGQPLIEWIYANSTVNDSFVAMTSAGYAMLDALPPSVRVSNAELLDGCMADLGLSVFVGFADGSSSNNRSHRGSSKYEGNKVQTEAEVDDAIWAPYLRQPHIDGAFHWSNSDRLHMQDGVCYCGSPERYPETVRWVEGKPLVVGRIALDRRSGSLPGQYEQCGSPETVSHALNEKVRGNSTEAFSMVPVRVHGSGAVRLSDVLRTIELLENGVEVVDAFEFVKRLNTLRPNKLRQSD